MSQRYGRIINMSSVAADVSNPGQANYAASKGGVEGFTRCIATELARRGVTANAVAPGFIQTDMTEAVVAAAGKEIKKKIPARRLGEPEDIANAVLFFAQESSSYVTGQIDRRAGGEGFHLVDVREESEFTASHLPDAIHLGKGVIERDIESAIPDADTPIVLYCGGGFRSALAALNLQQMGYTNVVSMDGGFSGWKAAGQPIV